MSRPIIKINLKELIAKNIKELEKDTAMLERIEMKLENKHMKELTKPVVFMK
jgi:hypothetical protein